MVKTAKDSFLWAEFRKTAALRSLTSYRQDLSRLMFNSRAAGDTQRIGNMKQAICGLQKEIYALNAVIAHQGLHAPSPAL